MTSTYHNVYDTLANFIAAMTPEKVMNFFAPPEIQQRLDELIDRKKQTVLTAEEERELEHFFIFEHIVRLAKIRAYHGFCD